MDDLTTHQPWVIIYCAYHTFYHYKNVTTLQTILHQIQKVESLLLEKVGNAIAQIFLEMIDNQDLFIEKTAHEILWGYDDPIFKLLARLGIAPSSQIAVRVRNIAVLVQTLLVTFHSKIIVLVFQKD